MRFFNTAGPVNCEDHYCLPPLERFGLANILMLIQQKKYFILHAPRQVGKTTFLLALRNYLNKEGTYKCLYINVEPAQAAREKVAADVRDYRLHVEDKVMVAGGSAFNIKAKSLRMDDFNRKETFRIYNQHIQETGQGFTDEALKEAGPQLLLQAFLQRIINSGGRIECEYGLGKKRTDLLIIWPHQQIGTPTHTEITKLSEVRADKKTQRVVIELKILYKL